MQRLSTLAAITFIFFTTKAIAHGGGLDGLGCHHNRKLGGYHCHQGPLAGQSFSSKNEALDERQGSIEVPTPAPMPKTVIPNPDMPTIGRASVIDGDTLEIHDVYTCQ